jgi:hypothetical protein
VSTKRFEEITVTAEHFSYGYSTSFFVWVCSINKHKRRPQQSKFKRKASAVNVMMGDWCCLSLAIVLIPHTKIKRGKNVTFSHVSKQLLN